MTLEILDPAALRCPLIEPIYAENREAITVAEFMRRYYLKKVCSEILVGDEEILLSFTEIRELRVGEPGPPGCEFERENRRRASLTDVLCVYSHSNSVKCEIVLRDWKNGLNNNRATPPSARRPAQL
jgi:hypothetical protein